MLAYIPAPWILWVYIYIHIAIINPHCKSPTLEHATETLSQKQDLFDHLLAPRMTRSVAARNGFSTWAMPNPPTKKTH